MFQGVLGEATSGGKWRRYGTWEPTFLLILICLQLSQQSRCPDFFLFLCRLLSPILKAFAQAATFLHVGQLPDSGKALTPLAVLRVGLSPTELGSKSNLPCRGRLLGAVVPVFTGLCPGRRALW